MLKKLARPATSFFILFSFLLSGIVAPVWFVPVSKASAAITDANCVQSVSGLTYTSIAIAGTSDCLVKFTSGSGTWTIPSGVSAIRLLLVGGGAGGQIDGGGGGGGGGGVTKDSVVVSAGTLAKVSVGIGGGSGSGGTATQLDLDGNNVYEWNAPGGSAGGAWETRLGGAGGLPTSQNSATTLIGGRGGDGPEPRGSGTNASNTGIQNGFQSNITDQTLWYGGGGGGGMGAHSNNNVTGALNGGDGGLGGGGRGAAQRPFDVTTAITWEYGVGIIPNPSVSLTAFCVNRTDYPKSTKGFPGLDGYGGGGGGGVAYGDGCKGATDTLDDGERTAGGDGGDGVVIIRYSLTAASQVTGLTATAGDKQITLNWSAPTDGGTPITDYVIEINSGNPSTAGDWQTIADGTSTNTFYTVTNLKNSENYYFRVSAVNAVGTGTASSSVQTTPIGIVLELDAANSSSYSGSGSTWTDLSGNAFNGTITGPTFVSESQYFSFDGSNDFVDLPDGFENFSSGLTIQVYADFGQVVTGQDSWERLIDLGNGSDSSSIYFSRSDGTNDLILPIFDGLVYKGECKASGAIVNGFADYAVTLNTDRTCQIFVNGVSKSASSTISILPPVVTRTKNYIGKSGYDGSFFDTGIKRVKVYNKSLTLSEINANRTFTVGSGTCQQTVYQDYSNVVVSQSADNNFCIVQFKNVGTTQWKVPAGVASGRVMIVGGGGGGGSSFTNQTGGSGGAGGFFESNLIPLSGNLDIGVGGGGAGTDSSTLPAGSGGDSYLGALLVGGGGGGNSVNIGNVRAGSGRGGSDYLAGGNGGGGRYPRLLDDGRLGGIAGTRATSVTFAGSTFTGINASAGGNNDDGASGGLGGSIAQASRTSDIAGSSTVYAKAGTYSPWSGLNQTFGSGGAANYNYGLAPGATGGNGAAGIVVVRYALAAVPNQVTGLSATAGVGQIGLEWTAPSDGGSAIEDYVIEQSTDNTNWTTVSDGVSTSTSYTVTGLTAGQIYYFRVSAKNAIGTGAVSSVVSVRPISEIDNSLTFDGSNDYLSLTGSQIIADTGDYTMEAWVYDTNTVNGNHVIIYHGGSTSNRSFIATNKTSTTNYISLGLDASTTVDTTISVPQNQWVHVALTRSGNTYSFYLNGTLRTTGTVTRGAFSDNVYIGSTSVPGNFWKGKIDQVKFYNDDLTASQVKESMNIWGGVSGKTLTAHFDFNVASTSVVLDQTANNKNLTINGTMLTSAYEDLKTETTVDGKKVISFFRSYLTALGGWKVPQGVSEFEYLVIGGGGGGGRGTATAHGSGGGGAGGYRSSVIGEKSGRDSTAESLFSVSPDASAYSVVVGAAGLGQAGVGANDGASNGGDSSFGNITATGGGRGADYFNFRASTGGSGGGGAVSRPVSSNGNSATDLGAAGTSNQGFAGGNAESGDYDKYGGGGGGAGAIGGSATSTSAGAGGSGLSSSVTGSSSVRAVGGNGGGGTTSNKGADASANTGSGGGGGSAVSGVVGSGGNGGSGIVILRYELFSPPSIDTHPVNTKVVEGNNATFSVSATNPTSYQWQVSSNNGSTWVDISGQTNSSLTLNSVTSGINNYQYRVVVTRTVSGESASVTSNAAILTVEQGATITGAICDNSYTKNGVKVNAGHGNIFYIDTGQGQAIDAGYIAYAVTSTSARSDLWVQVTDFSGGVVSLANPNDAAQPLGSVSANGSGTAFFMIKASGGTSTPQSHTVKIYDKKPTIGSPQPIYNCSFTFSEVAETIKAAANKVNSITSTTVSSLGATMTITVVGDTGTIGQGNDVDGRMIWLTPAARSNWPTNALRLESTSLTLYSNSQLTNVLSTHTNTLRVNASNGFSTNTRQYYRALYTFRVIGSASAIAPIIPVAMISSGTQIKHTDVSSLPTGGTSSVNLTNPEVDLSVTKSVSPTTVINTDGTTTLNYEITMTNGGSDPLVIDEVVDDPDNNLAFIANSAQFNGSSIDDPGEIAGGKVAFSGPMNLPANSSRVISYQMRFETCAVGSTYSFDNVATARTGTVVIGSGSASQQAVNIAGNCGQSQATVTIEEEPIPPEAITGAASNVTNSSASIAGVIDPNGQAGLLVRFIYGTSSILTGGTAVNLSNSTGALDGYGVSTPLTGLSGDTTYYYRIEIRDSAGNWVEGSILNFKTPPSPGTPDAVTQNASNITTSSAVLNGTIDPNYVSGGSKARFDWATSSSAGSCASLGTTQNTGLLQSETITGTEDAILLGGAPTVMTFSLSGLTSGEHYCYRIVALYSTSFATTDLGEWVPFTATAKLPQIITWGTSAQPLAAGGTTTVSATSDSGLAVTYTSADTSICTVNATTGAVTAVANSGSCVITASQSGNSTYYAAQSKTINFQISPPVVTPAALIDGTYKTSGYSQTLLATGGTGTYTTWSIASGSLPNGLSLNSGTGVISGTPSAAGIYNFSVTVTDTNSKTSSVRSFQMTIGKAPVVVTANSPSVIFGGATPAINPSYSGFFDSDSTLVATSPNIAPTCTTAYQVNMSVSQTPTTSCSGGWNENYVFSYVNGAVTIQKYPITITALNAVKQNIVNGLNTEVSQDPALRYVISPALPAGQTITDALPSGVTITRANSGTGIGTLVTANLPTGEIANSTHAITVTATPGANYEVTTVSATFTVQTPKEVLSLVASNKTITYGETGVPNTIGAMARDRTINNVSGTFTYYYLDSSGDEIAIDANTKLDAGSYTIKIKFEPTNSTDYFSPLYTTVNLDVLPKEVIITPQDKKKLVGQLDPALNWSVSGLLVGDSSSLLEPITITRQSGETAGTYLISTNGGGHPNYTITRANGYFYISKTLINITQTNGILTSRVVEANCGGAKPGETATFSVVGTSTVLGTTTVRNDGTCPITATLPDDLNEGNITLKVATRDPLDGAIQSTRLAAFIASAIINNNDDDGGGGSGGSGSGSGGSGGTGGGGSSTPTTSPSPSASPTPRALPNQNNNLPNNRPTNPPIIVPPNNNSSIQTPLPIPTNSTNPQAQGPASTPGATRPLPPVIIPSLPGLNRFLTPPTNSTGSNPSQNTQGGNSQRTVDFGTGVQTVDEVIEQGGSPTAQQAKRSLSQVQNEKLGGFSPPGAATRVEVIGARTNALFLFSNQSQIETFTLIEAINRSIPVQAQDFTQITNVAQTQFPRIPREWTEQERNYAAEIFAASGLAQPVNLRDLYSDQFNSWIKIDTKAQTYLPGSIVYLTITSDPLVIGSAVVDRNGNVEVSGDMPVEWLQSGEHRIRIVGIRSLDGVTIDDQGEVQLNEELIAEIEKFDLGTQATVTVIGPNAAGGEHAALRVVPLVPTAPWWTMWIILGVGLIALYLRRKNYLFNKQRRYAGLIAIGLASLPAVIIGWFSTVTIVVWVGLAATLLSLSLNWFVPVEKESVDQA